MKDLNQFAYYGLIVVAAYQSIRLLHRAFFCNLNEACIEAFANISERLQNGDYPNISPNQRIFLQITIICMVYRITHPFSWHMLPVEFRHASSGEVINERKYAEEYECIKDEVLCIMPIVKALAVIFAKGMLSRSVSSALVLTFWILWNLPSALWRSLSPLIFRREGDSDSDSKFGLSSAFINNGFLKDLVSVFQAPHLPIHLQ